MSLRAVSRFLLSFTGIYLADLAITERAIGQYDSHDFYGDQYVVDNCGGWSLVVLNCTEEQQVPCNSTGGVTNGTKIGGWCGPLSYPGIYEDKCTGLLAGECGGDGFGCGEPDL